MIALYIPMQMGAAENCSIYFGMKQREEDMWAW